MRHRALVYALEPVEVVGLAVACAFFLVCGRGGGVISRACVRLVVNRRGDGVWRGAASGRVAWRARRADS